MDDKQLLELIGRVDVETPGVPLSGLLRDHVRVGDYQARLLAIARAVQAAETDRAAKFTHELVRLERAMMREKIAAWLEQQGQPGLATAIRLASWA
jgi:hypothetical protein